MAKYFLWQYIFYTIFLLTIVDAAGNFLPANGEVLSSLRNFIIKRRDHSLEEKTANGQSLIGETSDIKGENPSSPLIVYKEKRSSHHKTDDEFSRRDGTGKYPFTRESLGL